MMPFVAYVACLVVFHCSEFLHAFLFQREKLSPRNWLFSRQYLFAQACAISEHWAEAAIAPELKLRASWISHTGLGIVMVGEVIRKAAMWTAAHNFTHEIRQRRHPEHRLVTHGIYSVARHPSYLGWMIWAVGTQVLLVNPVCTMAFAWAAWRFFRARIPHEEVLLVGFFGRAYEEYAARTPVWIPCIPALPLQKLQGKGSPLS